MRELNVLVVGMPNVGKSTLLNTLRNVGIPGRESVSARLYRSVSNLNTTFVSSYHGSDTEGSAHVSATRYDAGTVYTVEALYRPVAVCV